MKIGRVQVIAGDVQRRQLLLADRGNCCESELSAYVGPCASEEDLWAVGGLCRLDCGLACLLCRIGGENVRATRERVSDDLLDCRARVVGECVPLQRSNFDLFKSRKTHGSEERGIGIPLCTFGLDSGELGLGSHLTGLGRLQYRPDSAAIPFFGSLLNLLSIMERSCCGYCVPGGGEIEIACDAYVVNDLLMDSGKEDVGGERDLLSSVHGIPACAEVE